MSLVDHHNFTYINNTNEHAVLRCVDGLLNELSWCSKMVICLCLWIIGTGKLVMYYYYYYYHFYYSYYYHQLLVILPNITILTADPIVHDNCHPAMK